MFVTKRAGFAMILAIFVVMIIAILSTAILGTAARGAKSVSDRFFFAQANLLADSATEYAIMRAQGFDTSVAAGNDCLNNINIRVNDAGGIETYDISVSILYSFQGAAPTDKCVFLEENTTLPTTMLIDTTVSLHADANITTEPIIVHKRTQEKL
jgi:type II secretory pathway pseudopilin PulG